MTVKIAGYRTKRSGSKQILCPSCVPYMSDEDFPIYSDDPDRVGRVCDVCESSLDNDRNDQE